jgi:hypothetical protein
MKRWIRRAAWLYPAEWRARYGAEFETLLDDAPLQWRDLADVMRGAAIMQMTGWMSYSKMAILAGMAGAILAGGIAFSVPNQYVCTAALALRAKPGTLEGSAFDALAEANLAILGRDNLIALIKDPGLGLYPKERQTQTLEDIAEDVLRKHLHVVPFSSGPAGLLPFRIMFAYTDPHKAMLVVNRLTEEFQQELARNPGGPALSVLEGAVTPVRPTSPVRMAYVILGSLAGIAIGLVSFAIYRRTRFAAFTISIPRETRQFVDGRIAAGHYRNMNEYVRELIRADEQRSQ